MTPNEWREICEDVEALWPGSKKWSKADRLFSGYAERLPAPAVRAAVQYVFEQERQYAPPPAEVLAIAHRHVDPTGIDEAGGYCEDHGHLKAIMEDEPGRRVWRCARCGDPAEHEVRPDQAPTLAELETGELRPPEALTERIAP